MSFKHLNKIVINQSASIKTVLSTFNNTAVLTEGRGFAIIVDDEGKSVGVVSDGDIRRKIAR